MKFFLRFLVIWLINSLVFYLANRLYPQYFVLGTAFVPLAQSIVISGLLLTIICKAGGQALKLVKIKIAGRTQKFVFFWGVNFIAIWIIAKLAPVSGFGITKFYWAIALGFFASLVQWGERQAFKNFGLIKK